MKNLISMSHAALSEKGPVRQENQDRVLVADLHPGAAAEAPLPTTLPLDGTRILLAVADGMGGGPAGGEAASRALDCLRSHLADAPGAPAEALRAAIEAADRRVFRRAAGDPARRGMGTTLTAVLVEGGYAYIGHVGDSRAMLARGDELLPLTTDHTVLEKVMGRRSGGEAHVFGNLLAQCVGGREEGVAVELGRLRLRAGDTLVLTTDGLHGAVTPRDILPIVGSSSDTLQACRALVEAAIRKGTSDNATVLLARFKGRRPAKPVPGRADFTALQEVFYEQAWGRLATHGTLASIEAESDGMPAGNRRSWLAPTAGLVFSIFALVACAVLVLVPPKPPAVTARRHARRHAPAAIALPKPESEPPATRAGDPKRVSFRPRPIPAEQEEPAVLLRRDRPLPR